MQNMLAKAMAQIANTFSELPKSLETAMLKLDGRNVGSGAADGAVINRRGGAAGATPRPARGSNNPGKIIPSDKGLCAYHKDRSHATYICPLFRKADVPTRIQALKLSNACESCLGLFDDPGAHKASCKYLEKKPLLLLSYRQQPT